MKATLITVLVFFLIIWSELAEPSPAPTSKYWYPLGEGLNDTVRSFSWDSANNLLYAGTGSAELGAVWRWDGKEWKKLGTGTNGDVLCVLYNGVDIFIGGNFSYAGGKPAKFVAKWDGSNWASLTTGMNEKVTCLAWCDTKNLLYAGGYFTTAGGNNAYRIAKWDGENWTGLGSGLNLTVAKNGLLVKAGELYVGGDFTMAGGMVANHIAKWTGETWVALGGGTDGPFDILVESLAMDGDGNLYAGGHFTSASDTAANCIAKWDGENWSALGSGLNNSGLGLAYDDNEDSLYAVGYFTQAGGVKSNYVARWDGMEWNAMGTGFGGGIPATLVGEILYIDNNNPVYAGGRFTVAGGRQANFVAQWRLPTPTPVGCPTPRPTP